VIEGLSFLPPEALRSIATNGQLSRNVLDPVLERQRRASPAGTTRLVHALITHSQELASHFSGQHVLKKLYDYVGVAEKEAIASTLSRAKDALGRTKEGRSSLQHVLADVYVVDPKAWRAQVLKQAFASAMLEELETELTQTPGAAGDINIDTGADRKRKRKRRRSDAPGKSSSAVEPEKL
jgi:ferritin-like metal-binding protein YciE